MAAYETGFSVIWEDLASSDMEQGAMQRRYGHYKILLLLIESNDCSLATEFMF